MVDLVQCFKCGKHVARTAVVTVPTVDADGYGAPPLDRAWCGVCYADAVQDTEEAHDALDQLQEDSWDSKSPQETDNATL